MRIKDISPQGVLKVLSKGTLGGLVSADGTSQRLTDEGTLCKGVNLEVRFDIGGPVEI